MPALWSACNVDEIVPLAETLVRNFWRLLANEGIEVKNYCAVEVMVTGGMGRRAIGFFEQYGIEAVTGASGTVRYALERYLGGELRGVQPCRESIEHAHGELALSSVEGYEQDEAGRLREEAEMLRRQLDEVMARLEKLDSS